MVAGAIVAAIGAIVPLVLRHGHPPRPPVTPADENPAELPYPALAALAERVKTLQIEKRWSECLPGARVLLGQHALRGRLTAGMMSDYARILNNAAFESGGGRPRSSVERIALERQALEECERALASATTPRERAEAITLVGLVHEAWGFPYDAYLTYRAAMGVDPTYEVARQHYVAFVRLLHPGATGASSSKR